VSGPTAYPRHLLDVTDLDAAELRSVLELAQAPVEQLGRPLEGTGAALIFEKPSNRTRQSMEIAVFQLGGHPVYTRGEEVGFDTRETVEDVTRIMAGYHAVLAARVFRHSVVERMAAVSSVPVVNLLSDRASMGQEDEDARRRAAFAGFTVTEALMAEAGPDALFFHCLPAHRGLEVTAEVIDGPRSRVFPQGHNRLHAARGLLAFLAGVRP
jgi:ornithine carbamoyltransferase